MKELTHLDEKGQARMVDVSLKAESWREATATGGVRMLPATLAVIKEQQAKKGDVLAVARVAGIMAAKKTPDLIPLCHTLLLDKVTVDFDFIGDDFIIVSAIAKCEGKTGVEMEALTAVAAACLTIYDMCKAIDRGMVIENICLQKKSGGKSGTYDRGDK